MVDPAQRRFRGGWKVGQLWAWLSRPAAWNPSWTAPQRGAWGEAWARWHYFHHRGAAILTSNWRGGGGEIDFIAREGKLMVFVEVKVRDARDPEPLAAVRAAPRRRRFREAAEAYVRRLPRPRPAYRFDVVLVTPVTESPRRPHLNCLIDVFAEDRGLSETSASPSSG
jgi:putative endonuclease